MIARLISRSGSLLVAAATMVLLAAPTAAAHAPVDVEFDGGSIAGLWEDDAGTEFAFENLHYEYDECGARANELSCTWSIEVTLRLGSGEGCPPLDQEDPVIWSSGEQSGDATVDSGPQSGQFPACRNHALVVTQRHQKTYEPEDGEGPELVRINGVAFSFALLPVGAVAEAGQQVIAASPAASIPPLSDLTARSTVHRRLRIGAGCRSLSDDRGRYAFRFRQLACGQASRLVRRIWTGVSPRGYRCRVKADRSIGRCTRVGRPTKYFAWHPPSKRAARP